MPPPCVRPRGPRGPRGRVSALLEQLQQPQVAPCPCAAVGEKNLTIEPAPGLTLGAYVRGVSLQEGLSPEAAARVKAAFFEHGMLIFEGQTDLSSEKQAEFTGLFGEVEVPKAIISNANKNGEVMTREHGRTPLFREDEPWPHVQGGYEGSVLTQAWHADATYMPTFFKVNLLYCVTAPASGGGATEFADMRAGYAALDEETRRRIENLAAFHSREYSRARQTGNFPNANAPGTVGTPGARPGREAEEEKRAERSWEEFRDLALASRDAPGKVTQGFGNHGLAFLQPLVYTHPDTGRRSIFIANHAFVISGLAPEASEKLLDDLVAVGASGPRVLHHDWKPGDLVVWDNRCLLHRSTPFDISEPRVLRSSRVKGNPTTEASLPSAEGGRAFRAEISRLRELFATKARQPQAYDETDRLRQQHFFAR